MVVGGRQRNDARQIEKTDERCVERRRQGFHGKLAHVAWRGKDPTDVSGPVKRSTPGFCEGTVPVPTAASTSVHADQSGIGTAP